MKVYPEELKASLIVKMLTPNNARVADLARDSGIPKNTLYYWRRKALNGNTTSLRNPKSSGDLSSDEKFNIVLETAILNEVELGEYCRRKGLFTQQINAWRENCSQAQSPLAAQADRKIIRQQAQEIKVLEKDLRRMEKALAEAAALLVLKKKVNTFWEESEDKRSTS